MATYRHKDTHEVVAAYGPSTEDVEVPTTDGVPVPLPRGVFFVYAGGSLLPEVWEASVFAEAWIPQGGGDAEAPASFAGE